MVFEQSYLIFPAMEFPQEMFACLLRAHCGTKETSGWGVETRQWLALAAQSRAEAVFSEGELLVGNCD